MIYKFFVLLIYSVTAQLAFAGNYLLTIDNKQYDLSLSKVMQIKVGDQYFSVKIEKKDVLTYRSENFSFNYSSKYSPSTSDLGSGISQTTMMTPLGSLILVQEYQNINPSELIDLMITQVTKEEREYGYKIESSPSSITLSYGEELTGKVVSSKYKGSDIKRYFYTYGIKDSGLLIMTQIDYEIDSNSDGVIEKFIDSLIITMK